MKSINPVYSSSKRMTQHHYMPASSLCELCRQTSLLVPLLIIILTSLVVSAREAPFNRRNADVDDLRDFEREITAYMHERRVPGASVAIRRHGKFILQKAYGRADAKRMVTPWSLFRIGSVSKVVTALGILRLHDEGLVSLDAKVFGPKGILSEFAPHPSDGDQRILDISVRHLLQHTSGWDNRALGGDPLLRASLSAPPNDTGWLRNNVRRELRQSDDVQGPPTQADVIRYMMTHALQHEPGSKFSYSNVGYVILGRVIERATGLRYDQYINRLMMRVGVYAMKLGRTRRQLADLSEVEYFSRYPANRVLSVFPEEGEVSPPYGGFCLENMDASSGWLASAAELAKLVDSTEALLRKSTIQAMIEAPGYVGSDEQTWYGLGVLVGEGGDSWWHSGSLDGSTAVATHDGQTGMTWTVLMNAQLAHNDLNDLIRYAIRKIPSSLRGDDPPVANMSVAQRAATFSFAEAMANDESYLVKLMLPEDRLDFYVQLFGSKRYRLVWLSAVADAKTVHFNTIWRRNDPQSPVRWKAFAGLSGEQFDRRVQSKRRQGYRLATLETYVSAQRLRYAAIFERDGEAQQHQQQRTEWIAYHDYDPPRHKMHFFRNLQAGYRITVQAVTEVRGRLSVAAVYERRPEVEDVRVRMGLTASEYALELQRQAKLDRIPSYVKAYEYGGETRFSGIWGARQSTAWAASYDLTRYALLNRLADYAELNVPLACVTAYHDGETLKFAALWG